MTVMPDLPRLARRLRLHQHGVIDPVEQRIIDAWVRAYAVIRDDLVTAAEQAAMDGPLSPADFRRARLGRAMNEASVLLAGMNSRSREWSVAQVPIVTLGSAEVTQALSAEGAPRGVTFLRPDPPVLDAIVRRTSETIASRYLALSRSAEEALRVGLVRAVASGAGARDTAARMLRETRGVFGGGLARAVNLSRTELVDAYRAGSAAAREANDDVVTGWRWSSALDARTCPACWAMHNTLWPNSHPLEGHQQCRCVAVPVLKWDTEEDGLGDPAALFRMLPPDEQRKVMGPRRLALLDAGLPFDALAERRPNEGWRHGHYATPVALLPGS